MDGVSLRQEDYNYRCVAAQTQDELRTLNDFKQVVQTSSSESSTREANSRIRSKAALTL